MRSRRIILVVALSLIIAGCSGSIAADGRLADAETDTATQQQTHSTANGTLTVHSINVGQGDSTLIVGPTNETMLIDTGDWDDDGEHVLDYLDRQGINRIDHLVTTHADADHIGGHDEVISHYETEREGVGAVYDPGIAAGTATYANYLDAVEAHNVTLYETRENDTIPFEGVGVEVLGPPDPYLADKVRNENSIVLKLTHGETSFLFTGDAERAQESYLVEKYGQKLNATVLKAGHHGSDTSTGAALLAATDPEAAVISSTYDSQYGHPGEAMLDRLGNRMIPTYWTGTHGDVVFESDGETVTVKTQKAATTNPLRLRNASAVSPNLTDPVSPQDVLCDAPAVEKTTAPDGRTATTDGGATATDEATTVTTSDGTESALEVVEIHADAAGNDHENLNDEYVVFRNAGEEPLDLSGWTVADEADHTYTVPDGFTLDPGSTVTLFTGGGEDNDSHLYWGSDSAVWNNGGDTVVVTNANGEQVVREAY